MDAPGEPCHRLLGGGQPQDEQAEGGAEGGQVPAGAAKRVLRAKGTRTPLDERRADREGGAEPQDSDHHDGDTDRGGDMAMSDPELVEDQDTEDNTTDVNAMVRAMIEETNTKIDQIKARQDAAIVRQVAGAAPQAKEANRALDGKGGGGLQAHGAGAAANGLRQATRTTRDTRSSPRSLSR